ncbi:hypothetical protein BJ741DRAFT_597996 [Chytriomyces cf. hyalinus JEL632]|nr:hypothetical protein BJ741DRAFT_597996 [Chytriomyces cf. hyalinus JEL632]
MQKQNFKVREAVPSDLDGCTQVYCQGWIDGLSSFQPMEWIESINSTRRETLQKSIATNPGKLSPRGHIQMVATTETLNDDNSKSEKVVGVVLLGPNRFPEEYPGFEYELQGLFVDASMRGCGVPLEMIREGVRLMQWQPDTGMLLHVFELNARAVRFYTKSGARIAFKENTTKYAGIDRVVYVMAWDDVTKI